MPDKKIIFLKKTKILLDFNLRKSFLIKGYIIYSKIKEGS